jgi:gentisate 1,2-dioxygenase
MAIQTQTTDEFGTLTSLEQLMEALSRRNLTPGWIRREKPILWEEMHSVFVPAQWRYADARSAMLAAARLIGTDVPGERRNLVMRNPFPGNNFETLRTLVLAYQTMLPGETAKSHRHSSHAMRVILDAEDAYSIVNGEKTPMETGDIVLTPGWHWHGHGVEGKKQAFWIDCLDVPLTHLLEPMYYEHHPDGLETPTSVTPMSPMRFAWADTQAALSDARSDAEGYFGTTIDLPAPSMPTVAIKVHAWPVGWRNRPYRRSVNTAYVVLEGHGRSTIGEREMSWEFGDTIAAPAWSRIEHQTSSNAIVVALSDENLMRWAKYERLEPLD